MLAPQGFQSKQALWSCAERSRIIYEGSRGIRQWPVDLFTSPIMIHKITHYVGSLQLLVETFGHSTLSNQNSIKFPKVLKPTNKKTLLL